MSLLYVLFFLSDAHDVSWSGRQNPGDRKICVSSLTKIEIPPVTFLVFSDDDRDFVHCQMSFIVSIGFVLESTISDNGLDTVLP